VQTIACSKIIAHHTTSGKNDGIQKVGNPGDDMSWNLEDLRKSVELRFGIAHRRAMAASLESIVTRFQHVEYHIAEFIKFEKATVEGRNSLELIKEIFRFETRIDEASLKASAHALAAVQALHAISDILGTTIAMSLQNHREWKSYLGQICSIFPVECSTLAPYIGNLTRHENYHYLEALVNQSKHRNIITAQLQADLTGAEKNRFDFIQFERNGKVYGSREIKIFLEDEYNRQAKAVFDIGNELNRLAHANRP
jgi:hypothetical protein